MVLGGAAVVRGGVCGSKNLFGSLVEQESVSAQTNKRKRLTITEKCVYFRILAIR